jgi:hypothetical protein
MVYAAIHKLNGQDGPTSNAFAVWDGFRKSCHAGTFGRLPQQPSVRSILAEDKRGPDGWEFSLATPQNNKAVFTPKSLRTKADHISIPQNTGRTTLEK